MFELYWTKASWKIDWIDGFEGMMQDGKTDKIYEALKIPDRAWIREHSMAQSKLPTKPAVSKADPQADKLKTTWQDSFFELEYEPDAIIARNHFKAKSQPIAPPEKDPIQDAIRQRFDQMRDIAREHRPTLFYDGIKSYDLEMERLNAKIFYLQGKFMEDFEDDCSREVPCFVYYPSYQMMGYAQLRTYFTWRSQVRKGNVQDTSLSYAFLYIYELLNNIGVESPEDGFEKLISFWKCFQCYHDDLDLYFLRWVKDYYVYYDLSKCFKTYVDQYGISEHYPELLDPEDPFDFYCGVSKYDARKSSFYAGDRQLLMRECFSFTLDRLKRVCMQHKISLEDALFQPTKNLSFWKPFKDTLFHPCIEQRDRKVILSRREIYAHARNRWTYSTTITTESGKAFIGYVIKQMEFVLRKETCYPYRVSPNRNAVTHRIAAKLERAGVSLEQLITDAVKAFYREKNKIVVEIDRAALSKIREEAQLTQERLIVPEQEETKLFVPDEKNMFSPKILSMAATLDAPVPTQAPTQPESHMEPDPWSMLKAELNPVEREALAVILQGTVQLKFFADTHGVMVEVLLDSINEKAMDLIGDSLLDGEFMIYEDYIEQVKGLVE